MQCTGMKRSGRKMKLSCCRRVLGAARGNDYTSNSECAHNECAVVNWAREWTSMPLLPGAQKASTESRGWYRGCGISVCDGGIRYHHRPLALGRRTSW